ncbi:MAG TPA: cytochrome b N-terminal domain-containing protein [Candidatus Acidoferrales bacterium]|nr:cytochrome b N-terminal domain-containing protein [Candidatus Acidoferrales bacterium]
MRAHWDRLGIWLDHRTGIQTAVRNFLYEDIPASSGWHQVFGSVAIFLFMVQAFTGALLAFNYAPTPGDAYNSLRYILTELTGGRLIRGLHHWGASMMIVAVVLHMVQVFLYGAYKKPREATWMVGVVLMLVTLAYGLTGYLLPWDNRAYWGTVVTTRIAAQAPVMGPYLARLLGGGGAVGVVTFARFYGLHVLLLPPATLLLMALHVYLVRKHGVAPAPGDELVPAKKFYPQQVFKDTVAVGVVFAILFLMAVAVRVPLEQLADPTDTSYTPRPEWYFLFLFQTLKLFSGPLEVVGSVVLPGLAVLTLLLVPFIDRTRMVKVTRRFAAAAFVLLAAIGWGGLTAAAVLTTPKEAETEVVDYSAPTDWLQLSPEEMAGVAYFRKENCIACHVVGEHGRAVGPDLTKTAIRKDAAWMIQHFKRPSAMRPGSSMPPIQLTDPQLNSLAAFLLKLNSKNATALDDAPEFATDGALVYLANHCGGCHLVNGVGMKVGPPLNGLAKRQSRSYVEEHFANPQKLVPDSIMPAYKLSPKDLENLTSYLFALPE